MLLFSILYVWSSTEAALTPDKLQDAITAHSLAIFQELAKGEPNNFIVSPVSVSTVLAILAQGARGDTAKKLEAVLHLDSSQTKEAYGELSKHYQTDRSASNTILQFGSSLLLNSSFHLRPEFKRALVESFQSDVDQTALGAGKDARAVNEWASRATRGKIATLQDEEPPPITALVMASAMFFKSPWDEPFEMSNTFDRDFTVKQGHTVKVPSMKGKRSVLFAEYSELNAKVYILPFKDKQFSLLTVTPNEQDGLLDLIIKLTTSHVARMIATDASEEREVVIPRFKIRSTHELNTLISLLGLDELFFNPDLSRISPSEQSLAVSKLLQKATIEIDEEGIEAAAATGAVAVSNNFEEFQSKNPTFVFDRPFVAMIVDHKKKVPLFMAAVVDPSSEN